MHLDIKTFNTRICHLMMIQIFHNEEGDLKCQQQKSCHILQDDFSIFFGGQLDAGCDIDG